MVKRPSRPDKDLLRVVKENLITTADDLKEARMSLSKSVLKRHLSEITRSTLQRNLARKEAKVTLEVCNTVNEQGKPIYGNESIRNAEITNRLETDADYAAILKTDDETRRLIANLRAKEEAQERIIKRLEVTERILLADYESRP